MKKIAYAILMTGALFGSASANAADGCKVLLCLAGNWSNISQCVPPVREVLRDVARGRPWPSCSMGGASNTALQWATEATCPPFYSYYDPDRGSWAGCRYDGMISVRVNGSPWSDLFWSTSGDPTSTRYYTQARTALGAAIDPTYDRDAAAYVPPVVPGPGPDGGGP